MHHQLTDNEILQVLRMYDGQPVYRPGGVCGPLGNGEHIPPEDAWRYRVLLKKPWMKEDRVFKNAAWMPMGNLKTSAIVIQMRLKEGYAIPIYFSLGHWANGMNAIQLGVGVEKMEA